MQLLRAWRYLGLVNDSSQPQDLLLKLVFGGEEEQRQVLKTILTESYTFIFGPDSEPLNLEKATDQELVRRFEQQGTGLTVRRCVTFFTRLAQDAGLPLSRELGGEQKDMQQESGIQRASNGAMPLEKSKDGANIGTGGAAARQNGYVNFEAPIPRLPEFNPLWSIAYQEKWLDHYGRVLSLIEREKKPEA